MDVKPGSNKQLQKQPNVHLLNFIHEDNVTITR